jgi:hypothetical protein
LHFAVEWAQDNLAITPKSTLMPLPLTQAERKQRKAERVAREKKMVQHLHPQFRTMVRHRSAIALISAPAP